jgi:superfamily I DNA/RNA helicase
MNDLTITWAESRTKWGKRQPTIVSRFIGEMRADNEEGADDEQQPPGDRDDQGESAVGGV